MIAARNALLAVFAAALLVGCGPTTSPSPTPVAGAPSGAAVFDPSSDLAPQMDAAIDSGNVDIVVEILDAGYDLTTDLGAGTTALHRAAASDEPAIVDALIAAGASLELRAAGFTPLMFAAVNGDAHMVTALLEAGADPNARYMRFYGAQPIHLAAQYGNVETLDALLAWGIDIEALDNDGASPVMYAGYGGQMNTTLHLLDLGVDLTVRDSGGFTARGLANLGGFSDVAQAIADAGGEL